jgi:hypothetical protein
VRGRKKIYDIVEFIAHANTRQPTRTNEINAIKLSLWGPFRLLLCSCTGSRTITRTISAYVGSPSACFSEDFRKAQCYALCTRRRSHGGHPTNQRETSARKDKSKPSPASLRLRGRGKMPDVKSRRVHILRQLAVPVGVAAEKSGNHLLLSVTGRSERCRSGSEISRAGLYQRHGAKGRCRSVEGGWLLNDLIFLADASSFIFKN